MDYEYTWPLSYSDLLQIRGLWRVPLPDDKHPDAVLEICEGTPVWVHKEKWTLLWKAEKQIDHLNEWKRQRGGRKKDPDKPNPREYLNEVQHPSVS